MRKADTGAQEEKTYAHTTVLLHEGISSLNLKEGDAAIDATVGLGGHTEKMAQSVGLSGRVLGIEADKNSLALAKVRLKPWERRLSFALGTFRDIDGHALRAGLPPAQGILFDLGWNATQLSAGRGFSFDEDEPLLMTYEELPKEGALTARDVVNRWSKDDLADIIRTLGEDRFADRIASHIVLSRKEKPIETARELKEIIERAVSKRSGRSRIHPATKTFQALRMVVNNELAALSDALPKALGLLKSGGRLSVITFHSLEDGLVKRIFKGFAKEHRGIVVNKKPLSPTRREIEANPRARSAKLRTIEKL